MSLIRINPPADPDSLRASDHPLELNQADLAHGIDWAKIFGNANPVELEIGCGKGMFTCTAAQTHPDVNWFALERSSEHLRRAMDRVVKAGLTNVRFVKAQAEDLIGEWTPTSSLRAVHILYPDPWPKKRHHKRRLLGLQRGPQSARDLARIIAPGGWLSVATDHLGYAEVIPEVLDANPDFERTEGCYSQTLMPDAEAPLTEFERKYRAQGRDRFRFTWRRV